jgi:hypothetical protein
VPPQAGSRLSSQTLGVIEAMSQTELVALAFAAFAADISRSPAVTLRAGNELDEYKTPSPFVAALDVVTDEYLEQYTWGVGYLDAPSWRHYLPHLIEYALRHIHQGSNVTDALLYSLRPPDREPPRLASLSPEQEALVTRALDALAFSEESAHQELACQVLEEWWSPGALYRTTAE